MISNTVFIVYGCTILIGVLAPIIGSVVWIKKTKQPVRTLLIGAAIFFIFAIILESIPKTILFTDTNAIGRAVMSNVALYMIMAALLAGIFEEVGRFVAFKYLLKNRKDKLTAITYGIGHGGLEVIYLLVIGGIQSIFFAVLINSGEFDAIVTEVALEAPSQLDALKVIPQALASVSFTTLIFTILERISAMLIHISCSIIVFKAVHKKGNLWMMQLAILLHASIDFIAAMYQMGVVSNLFIVEAIILGWAIVLFYVSYKRIYEPMPNEVEE